MFSEFKGQWSILTIKYKRIQQESWEKNKNGRNKKFGRWSEKVTGRISHYYNNYWGENQNLKTKSVCTEIESNPPLLENYGGYCRQYEFNKYNMNSANTANFCRKMAQNSITTISFNVNESNTPIKIYRVAGRIRKLNPTFCFLQETHLNTQQTLLKVKSRKKYSGKQHPQKCWGWPY